MISVRAVLPHEGKVTSELVAEAISLALHAVLVVSVIAAMNRVDGADRVNVLAPLALAGLVLGYMLSRTTLQDLVAHSIALWSGAAAAVVLVTAVALGPGEIVRSRGSAVIDLVQGVTQSLYGNDERTVEDNELLVVLGVTAWLLAYSSAWVIYRRGWFGLGVAVPAAILLASIRVENENGGWPLALFIFATIGLSPQRDHSEPQSLGAPEHGNRPRPLIPVSHRRVARGAGRGHCSPHSQSPHA
jgi:hypothetical protein